MPRRVSAGGRGRAGPLRRLLERRRRCRRWSVPERVRTRRARARGRRAGQALSGARRAARRARSARCRRWTACRSSLAAGETLGLVGESGCGKSTTGKAILRLVEPTSGTITARRRGHHAARPRRDASAPAPPAGDLPGSVRVAQSAHVRGRDRRRAACATTTWRRRDERTERVARLFARVGLRPDQMRKYPHEFSGGQRQRLGIARALAVEPRVIVCDEPVSALDVSVQAQVINLLVDLQAEFGLSYLFIAHDLAVVEHICHRVAVMYLGRIVELAPRRALFAHPQHPVHRSAAVGGAGARSRPGDPARAHHPRQATCRAPSIRPPDAAFTRAVRTCSTAAGPNRRNCGSWRPAITSRVICA